MRRPAGNGRDHTHGWPSTLPPRRWQAARRIEPGEGLGSLAMKSYSKRGLRRRRLGDRKQPDALSGTFIGSRRKGLADLGCLGKALEERILCGLLEPDLASLLRQQTDQAKRLGLVLPG